MLIDKAKVRQVQHNMAYEATEREMEDHLYGDADKLVTNAYKKKLLDMGKWKEEKQAHEVLSHCPFATEIAASRFLCLTGASSNTLAIQVRTYRVHLEMFFLI